MKKHLPVRLLALLTSLALLTGLAGCAPRQTPQTAREENTGDDVTVAPGPEEQDPEPELSLSLSYEPAYGLDPYDCMRTTNRILLGLLYEGLFHVDAQGTARPILCQSYTVSDDGKTYTFQLQPDVTFHNGAPLQAKDVVYSLNQAKGSAYYGNRLDALVSVTQTGSLTLQITLSYPMDSLPLLLDIPVIPENARPENNPAGTGPYTLSGTTLKAYAGWWQDRSGVWEQDAISLVEAETATQIRDQFESGQIQVVCADPVSDGAAVYHSDYELWSCPTTIFQFVGFNQNRGPFADETLRAALTYGVDRKAIVSQLCDGFAQEAVLPIWPTSDYYDTQLAAQYTYDPEKLAQTVRAQGSQGQELLFLVCSDSSQRVAAARQIADALNGCGFSVTVSALPYEDYKQALLAGNFDLYYGQVRLSPTFDLKQFFAADGSLNFGGLADESMVRLCQLTLENMGNSYDLYRQILSRGLICPVLFRTYAVYTTRGLFSRLSPTLDHVLWPGPEPEATWGASQTGEVSDGAAQAPDSQTADGTAQAPDAQSTDSTTQAPDAQSTDSTTQASDPRSASGAAQTQDADAASSAPDARDAVSASSARDA